MACSALPRLPRRLAALLAVALLALARSSTPRPEDARGVYRDRTARSRRCARPRRPSSPGASGVADHARHPRALHRTSLRDGLTMSTHSEELPPSTNPRCHRGTCARAAPRVPSWPPRSSPPAPPRTIAAGGPRAAGLRDVGRDPRGGRAERQRHRHGEPVTTCRWETYVSARSRPSTSPSTRR